MGNGGIIGNGRTGHGRARVRSRAIGCLFFLGFGALWIYTGLMQTHHRSRAALLSAGAVCAVLLAMSLLLLRRANGLPAGPGNTEDELRAKRMFAAVNIIQWVSIGTALVVLQMLSLPEYVVPAIAIIVGLHLFPLAGSFHHRQHYVTGTLLLVWPLGCLAMVPRERVSGVTALGVGSIVLASAFVTLWKNLGVKPLAKAGA
ncbi:MAG TPA: hypothetical protein VGC24_02345 [Burkholderiaceae bacterium]